MVLILLAIVLLGVIGMKLWASWGLGSPLVTTAQLLTGDTRDTLFVLVHGFEGGPHTWRRGTTAALVPYGDVLVVQYPAGTVSNADAHLVSRGIGAEVQKASRQRSYDRIVLIGHSMGALLTRKAFLYAVAAVEPGPGEGATPPAPWGAKVDRIVLMAGTNRGWDVSGQKPTDMGWMRYLEFWAGSWLGWFTGTGRLIFAMETGSPFVADLRLEWMRWFRDHHAEAPHVVQLLGDIDDIVSDEDNKDLRVAASGSLTYVRVRGTGHLDITRLDDSTSESGGATLGEYRRDKLLRAALAPPEALQRDNEEQPFRTDDDVTHLVFVLHGIRDLGRWSAEFEGPLLERFKRDAAPGEKLAIASVRYGYFGMGPFILRFDRQKYVRWFMDQYTETLARFPNARRIDFVGHSNGTYLLASALEHYRSLKIHRVVFAGSVVRVDYDWQRVLDRGQVQSVRNYVASDDWVVALFPRFFEQRPVRVLGNDIGSAGFNGFSGGGAVAAANVQNVGFITGQHSAFLSHVPSIVDFLMAPDGRTAAAPAAERGERFLKFVSDWGCWAVWLLLIAILVGVAAFLAHVSGLLAVPVVIAFAAIVLAILYVL